ncbi:MAG: FAD-binding protein [Thermoanaerobaculia bacterium]|nr:FAD-binding protein [Thermoanaerobaculia bacterium]
MSTVARDTADVRDVLASGATVLTRAGGTKRGLSGTPPPGVELLDVSALSGVSEHLPSEFTLLARAATPVAEVEALLAAAGQYLPFDPMLAASGATLGGTIAAGASGPGRVRYGGVRDFVLGVTLVDGTGTEIRGGGRVVKNAAGFDVPKLMVGSLGSLGVMTEVCLKVFPAPEATLTLRADTGSLEEGLTALAALQAGPYELDALDLDREGRLWVRLAGRRRALASRAERVQASLPGAEVMAEPDAAAFWSGYRELDWLARAAMVVRVPITPRRIPDLDAGLPDTTLGRYSAAGQVAWLGWPAEPDPAAVDELLRQVGLCGLRWRGQAGRRLLGATGDGVVRQRLRTALDPEARLAQI